MYILMCRCMKKLSHMLKLDFEDYPRGSEYPTLEVSVSKHNTLDGFWNPKPHMLDTWTLWVQAVCDNAFNNQNHRARS